MTNCIPDPTWERLGFSEPPDSLASGKGIGIVIIDTIKPHSSIRHLGSRIKCVTVQGDMSITSRDIAFEDSIVDNDRGEHGLMSVLTLAHEPFEIEGRTYVGIAPAATFIILDHGAFKTGEGERLKRGIDWILERKDQWNIKIILSMGWHALDNAVYLKNTSENSTVQALASAVKRGILVICSNGNTRLNNIMPPIDYLTVGGYNDRGHADRHLHVPYPDEPYGQNADGHLRPDVLAPRVYLVIPFCEAKENKETVSYYWGTSGAATLVAGVAAYMLSKFPNLKPNRLRDALVEYGDPIAGYDNPAPRIHVAKVIGALSSAKKPRGISKTLPCVRIKDPHVAIQSADDIERGLALSMLVQRNLCSREYLWKFTADQSPVVRKIAVLALHKPNNEQERQIFWKRLDEEVEGGVRGWYAYGLLENASEKELSCWIKWATDINWSVRWCVSEYLAKYPESFPQLEKTHDPDSVQTNAMPVQRWYAQWSSLRVED